MPRGLSGALNLSCCLLSHFGDLTVSSSSKSRLFCLGLSVRLFLHRRNLCVKLLKSRLYLGQFRERLVPLLARSLEFSLNPLTSCPQGFANWPSEAPVQVKPAGNKNRQINELPQLQPRIVPPWVDSRVAQFE